MTSTKACKEGGRAVQGASRGRRGAREDTCGACDAAGAPDPRRGRVVAKPSGSSPSENPEHFPENGPILAALVPTASLPPRGPAARGHPMRFAAASFHRARCSFPLLLALAHALGAGSLAFAGDTSLTMTSEPGDYVGNGRSYSYTLAQGTFSAQRNYEQGVSVAFD